MDFKIIGKLYAKLNDQWPPKINTIIVINHPSYKNNLFVGSVNKYLLNNTACLVILLNNRNYNDPVLKDKKIILNESTNGLFLLYSNYGWKYVNLSKFLKIFGYDPRSLLLTQYNMPHVQADLTNEAIYKDPSKIKETKYTVDDDFKDTSLLNEKGELQFDGLFKEKEINETFDPSEKFTQLDDHIMNVLKIKLDVSEAITEDDKKIIVNKNIAIKNIIDTKEDEINEGKKITDWIMEKLITKKTDDINIFGDLKMSIFNGYVHFARKGLKVDDVITKELVPNLNFFKWQYGIPIDYDTLKYLVFQSDFQRGLKRDIEEQKDAEKIFSQEYLISLQPEPKYQMWCLTRLIMAWYGDKELQYNIRKIKILINQWRAISDQEFNRKYGTLPSIVVYPKYGKNSAKLVLSKISQYFLLYQNIGWKSSTPSYFVKVNDLLWYTNGSIDLKLYFRRSLRSYDGKTQNTMFDKYFSSLLSAEKLLHEI